MIILILILVCNVASVMAQDVAPHSPAWLQVVSINAFKDESKRHHTVTIQWRHGKVDSGHPRAEDFVVMRFNEMEGTDPALYQQVAVVPGSSDVMTYVDSRVACGEYRYQVVGRTKGVSSKASPEIVAVVRGGTCTPASGVDRYIDFSTYPSTVLIAGRPFEYRAKAVHSIPSEQPNIRYELVAGPSAMNVDSLSGILTWDGVTTDFDSDVIKIRAYHTASTDESTVQKWQFRFATDEEIALLDPTPVDDEREDGRERRFSVSPNPASDKLNITFPSNGEEATIEIITIDGAIVRRMNVAAQNGMSQQTISVSNLPVGAYQLRIHAGGRDRVLPIRIQR